MRYISLTTLALLFLSAFGISISGHALGYDSASNQEKGELVIYRAKRANMGLVSAEVSIDSVDQQRLKNNQYQVYELTPGDYEIAVSDGVEKVKIRAGETTYLRFRIGWKLFNLIPFAPESLSVVGSDVALEEMKKAQQASL